jgi:hypothetical protein
MVAVLTVSILFAFAAVAALTARRQRLFFLLKQKVYDAISQRSPRLSKFFDLLYNPHN